MPSPFGQKTLVVDKKIRSFVPAMAACHHVYEGRGISQASGLHGSLRSFLACSGHHGLLERRIKRALALLV